MTVSGAAGAGRKPVVPCAVLLVLAAAFAALAVWQVQRLHWKEALISRVDAGMRATPLPLERVAASDPAPFEYRRVIVSGRYRPSGTVLVSGASTRGSGYWVLAPLQTAGGIAYVNRGFMPLGTRIDTVRRQTPTGPVTVIGLLRVSEPGGGFLRANRPAEDRWYSRDIATIAAARHQRADPRLFVDAFSESPAAPYAPIAGLTVVNFPNNHLSYALTWAALAILSAGGAFVLWRKAR